MITPNDIGFLKAVDMTYSPTSGGRMSNNAITSNTLRNLFADVDYSELQAGTNIKRKLFVKNSNTDNLSAHNPLLFLGKTPTSTAREFLILGTQTNTLSGVGTSPRRYGCCNISQAVAAGDTIVKVTTPSVSYNLFQVGDTVVITSRSTPAKVSSDPLETDVPLEVRKITAVSYSGDTATITVDSAFDNPYPLSRVNGTTTYYSRVASCITQEVIRAKLAYTSKASTAGTFDDSLSLADNTAAIQQTITLTFTSPTSYAAVGDTLGSLGTGSVSTNFSPINPTFSRPYFLLAATSFGGTWVTGDTLTLTLSPASIPVWLELLVPSGSTAVELEMFRLWVIFNSGSN